MNIVLLGYRGTGKSSVARFLAKNLKRKLFCIDELIVESAGMPVPQIVGELGWPGFREIERRVVEEVSGRENDAIIDCGGGVVLDDRNVRNLRKNGKTVLLTASFEAILKRIHRDPNRPPLKEGLSFEEEQRQIIEERADKYRAAADMLVDTTRGKPGETAMYIIRRFKEMAWI
ncbi:MAG: shikimate kinase [Nitrospinae bacterium]|nr:shikimate kinase [Nitrospinota bacterium]